VTNIPRQNKTAKVILIMTWDLDFIGQFPFCGDCTEANGGGCRAYTTERASKQHELTTAFSVSVDFYFRLE
jgi:hypothetical protein